MKIRSIPKKSNDFDEKYMKIKWMVNQLDDDLPLNKMIEIYNLAIVDRAIFYENNKYFPQVFFAKCLYKLQKEIRTQRLSRTTKLNCAMKKQKYNL